MCSIICVHVLWDAPRPVWTAQQQQRPRCGHVTLGGCSTQLKQRGLISCIFSQTKLGKTDLGFCFKKMETIAQTSKDCWNDTSLHIVNNLGQKTKPIKHKNTPPPSPSTTQKIFVASYATNKRNTTHRQRVAQPEPAFTTKHCPGQGHNWNGVPSPPVQLPSFVLSRNSSFERSDLRKYCVVFWQNMWACNINLLGKGSFKCLVITMDVHLVHWTTSRVQTNTAHNQLYPVRQHAVTLFSRKYVHPFQTMFSHPVSRFIKRPQSLLSFRTIYRKHPPKQSTFCPKFQHQKQGMCIFPLWVCLCFSGKKTSFLLNVMVGGFFCWWAFSWVNTAAVFPCVHIDNLDLVKLTRSLRRQTPHHMSWTRCRMDLDLYGLIVAESLSSFTTMSVESDLTLFRPFFG